jgi:nucleoside 2-deoxyribosyltransferase
MTRHLKVYLAGPDVFRRDASAEGRRLKARCKHLGVVGLLPADPEDTGDDTAPSETAKTIYEANLDLLHACDAVVANMTPFRGPSMDVGTTFEIGYAAALGKLIVGYTADNRDYIEKAADHFDGGLRETDGQWRDPDDNRVENFGLPDNLMVVNAVLEVVDDFDAAIRLLLHMRREAPFLFDP